MARKSAAPKRKAGPGALNGFKPRTLTEIAKLLGAELVGPGGTLITGICGIKEARPGDVTFVANSKYLSLIDQTRASAVITSLEIRRASKPILRTENPSLAFSKLIALLAPRELKRPQGVSPKAVVAKGVHLGAAVAIQPFAVIEEGAAIGDRTIVMSGCYVGHGAVIGNDCLLYPNVSIRESVEIGHRVIVHSGTVIGSDGFGFVSVKGTHHKIPQIGTVVIEDDVEIGANVTIDRARFGRTVVGQGTKIDNLVQIAHNVVTGKNCLLVAQTGISGSSVLGNNVVLAGQAGVVGHVTIGDNVMVGAQSGVTKSVPANTNVLGFPAKPLAHAKKVYAVGQRLPELYREVKALKKRIQDLEEESGSRKPRAVR
ncbi:MAG: UDP-3-O-(3-hydroxymyristoyl)glucosamine N-acyltransferase [Candidatus Omnitrophica bacterium]|nr:UDP-3-O-(3-hydroxymyristoyl)glucosamine N-acyltransferase [Candidatus Omnitrophota bacterium]